jgi:transglutaminase-like putative cysteine protease
MILIGLLFSMQVFAVYDKGKDTEFYKTKYKGYTAFYQDKEETLYFTLEDDQPKFINSMSSSLYVLSDHAKNLADNREFFSTKYELESINGYTLVPSGKGYKKIEAPEYTKSSVIGSGVFYDDNITYSFNFPAISQGSKLVTEAKASVQDVYFPFRFYFGSGLPVESARFKVEVPKGTRLKYKLMGMDSDKIIFSKTTERKKDVYTWQAKDLDAYQDDFMSPDWLYYIPHIVVQIAGYEVENEYRPVLENTDQLYKWAYSKIKEVHNQSPEALTVLSDSIVKGLSTERDKVNQIFKWVQNNIKYVAIEDGDNGFIPRDPLKVLNRRYGDCKDKTSIMVTMLESQGIDASFAWIGTRSLPYKYTDIPSLLVDNHMIAVWWEGDVPRFLDGTTQYHALDDVPAWIQGKQCMVERGKTDYQIVTVPIDEPHVNTLIDSISVQLKGDVVSGTIKSIYTGERKADLLRRLNRVRPEKIKNFLTDSRQWSSNKFLVDSASVSDLSEVDKPLQADYSFHLSDYITTKEKTKYINLNFDRVFSRLKIKKDRVIPIEAEMKSEQKLVTSLSIPEGYSVNTLPTDVGYSHPKFSFSSHYKTEDGKVILESDYQINFHLLEGDEIAEFRKMISKMKRASMQSIVLSQN